MRTLVYAIVCFLIVSAIPTAMAAAKPVESLHGTQLGLVGLESGLARFARLSTAPLSDYGGYSVYQVGEEEIARLDSINAPYFLLPDPDYLGIESVVGSLPRIDTGQLPPSPGLVVIQFPAPPKQEWRRALEENGMMTLAYIPNYAYLVVSSRDLGGALTALPLEPRLFAYESSARIDPRLILDESPQRVRFVLLKASGFADPIDVMSRHGLRPQVYWERESLAFAETWADRATLEAITQEPSMVWVEPAPTPKFFDEISDEILGGNFTPGMPWDGDGAYIHSLGYTGSGIIVAIADTGVDTGNLTTMHPDLRGQIAALIDFGETDPSDGVAEDGYGHGTHVSGIVAGTGASNGRDLDGYLYGMGIAPNASIVMERISDDQGYWMAPADHVIAENAVRNGASVSSNSWGSMTYGVYDWQAAEYDALTRDADLFTPGGQPLLHVFAAANSGPSPYTLASPAVAKNVLTVAASENYRPAFGSEADNPEDIADFSSRGPVADGRFKPDIAAPGTYVASALSSFLAQGMCGGPLDSLHEACSGTSMATPHVAGGAAIFQQYYRGLYGVLPSPAMTKAALINTAHDMTGAGASLPIPNTDEGWGRMDLVSLLGLGRPDEYADDQTNSLQTGQDSVHQLTVMSSAVPLRITMAYTDAPAAGFSSPTLVNDLDLVVTDPTGRTFWGNMLVNGRSIDSITGGDRLNNVESVYIQNPEVGLYTVRVLAINVPEDGVPLTPAIDQDFALFARASLEAPPTPSISFNRDFYTAPSNANVSLAGASLNADPLVRESVNAVVRSDTEPLGESLTLTEVGLNSSLFIGTIGLQLGAPVTDGVLQVLHGDLLNVTYTMYYDVAWVDTVAPTISNIATNVRTRTATVTFTTSEDTKGLVEYGDTTSLGNISESLSFAVSHSVDLVNLKPNTTYFFDVVATDLAGNRARDDNGGLHHALTTEPLPPILLVDDEPDNLDVSFSDALSANGFAFEVSQGPAPFNLMKDYRIVIWTTGADGFDTLTASDESALASYLDGGGSLFLSSEGYLWRGVSLFTQRYLHVASSSPLINPLTSVQGVPGDPISGDFPDMALSYPQSISAQSLDPDLIATGIFEEPLGTNVAVKADAGTYRVVFFAFPYEASYLADSLAGTQLMYRIIQWFGFGIGVDLAVVGVTAPAFAPPGAIVQVNATVVNHGASAEVNVLVNFTVDGAPVDSQMIPSIDAGKSTDVSFQWTASTETTHSLTVEVSPAPGETVLSNNARSVTVLVTSAPPIKVAVIDSMGTQNPYFWDYLQLNWPSFGPVPITVDTTTLAGSGFTYADIVSTKANVLDISCGMREYTTQEIAAIEQYLQGDRGLVGTCTISSTTPGNAPLARLWGISDSLPFTYYSVAPVTPISPSNPLFRNVTVPYTPGLPIGTSPSNDLSWDADDLTTGTYAGISLPVRSSAVVTNGLNVYFSPFVDVGDAIITTEDDYQIMYNALMWAGSGAGIAVSHAAPPSAEVNTPFDVTANLSSNYDIVSVEAWYQPPGSPSYQSVPMSLVMGSPTNGTWSVTIPSQSAIGPLHLYVEATNTGGRNATTQKTTVRIVDTTAPVIIDITSGIPVTHSPFTFAASVTDNLAVGSVHVEYWYGTGGHTNLTMILAGGLYQSTITVPNTTASLSYKLSAVDSGGLWTVTNAVTLSVSDPYPPTAVVNDPFEIEEDRLARFDSAGSWDNVGIVNFTWDFSDGIVLYGAVVFRIFADPGRYDATLTVRDAASLTGVASTFVLVTDTTPPVARISVPASVDEDTAFIANGSGSSDNVAVVNFTWSINGIPVAWGPIAILTVWNPGLVGVTLDVRDLAGNNATAASAVTVRDITPPLILIDGGTTTRKISAGDSLSFDASGTTDNVGVHAISWDFGDGTNATGSAANHRFEKPGTYTLTVRAFDAAGNAASVTIRVDVEDSGLYAVVGIGILIAAVALGVAYLVWARLRSRRVKEPTKESEKEEEMPTENLGNH